MILCLCAEVEVCALITPSDGVQRQAGDTSAVPPEPRDCVFLFFVLEATINKEVSKRRDCGGKLLYRSFWT